jgi:hypothetical protein
MELHPAIGGWTKFANWIVQWPNQNFIEYLDGFSIRLKVIEISVQTILYSANAKHAHYREP